MKKVIFPTAKADGERLEEVTGSHKQLWRYSAVSPAFSQVENKPRTGWVGLSWPPLLLTKFSETALVRPPPSFSSQPATLCWAVAGNAGWEGGVGSESRHCCLLTTGASFPGLPGSPPWTPAKTSALPTPPGSCGNWHKTAYMYVPKRVHSTWRPTDHQQLHMKSPRGEGRRTSIWSPSFFMKSSHQTRWLVSLSYPICCDQTDGCAGSFRDLLGWSTILVVSPISVRCWLCVVSAFRSVWANPHVSDILLVSCMSGNRALWYPSHIGFSSLLLCVEVRRN